MVGVAGNEQSRDKVAFGLLVTFAAVMFIAPGEWFPELAPLRIALVTSSLASGLMFFSRLGRREPIFFDGIRGWALIGFAAWTAASSAWSLHPENTLLVAIDCVKYVAIYLTIVNLVTTPKRLQALALAMVVGAIFTARGGISHYLAGINLVEGYRAGWVGTYADPNRMSMSLQFIVPIAAAFLLRKQMPLLVKIVAALAGVLCVVAIVFSHSRGSFIGLAFSMVLWVLLSEKKANRFAVMGLAAIALVIFAPKTFWNRTGSVSDFRTDAAAMGRVHAWSVASRISLDKPLLGVGAGSFRVAWPLYAPHEAVVAYEAHNVFLQVLAELGIFGFLLFLTFLGASLEGAWKGRNDPDSGWLARALLAASAGYLVCNLSAGFLGSSPHFYVLFGLASAAERVARARTSTALAPTPAAPRGFQTTPSMG